MDSKSKQPVRKPTASKKSKDSDADKQIPVSTSFYKNVYLQSKMNKQSSVSRRAETKSSQKGVIEKSQFLQQNIARTQIQTVAGTRSKGQVQRDLVCKSNFNSLFIIGKGGFGKVWKVQQKKSRKYFAMKEMYKAMVMTKKSVQSVLNQRTLLSTLQNPFLVNIHYAFQDRQMLYLVLDLMQGGDLRYQMSKKKKYSESQAKFLMACVIVGLQYLHNRHIIHRDIKPENLVFDNKGYLRITDLGIARIYRADNASDTSGTPGYMAPEVLFRKNHSFTADYYALGVIVYEIIFQKRPYNGRSRKQIRDQVYSKSVLIKKQDLPEGWAVQSADFVTRLLSRNPSNRLGAHGIQQLKSHPWLKRINWRKVQSKQIQAPAVGIKQNFDQDPQITVDDQQQIQSFQKNSLLLRKPEIQQVFNGYYYEEAKVREEKGASASTSKGTSNSSSKNSSKIYSKEIN